MPGRFRLQRLLRVRERVRQLRQHEAAALAKEVRRLEQARAALIAQREQHRRDEDDALARAPLDVDAFGLRRQYDRALEDAATRCGAERASAAAAFDVKRDQVTGARREERKLERVRDAHARRSADEAARAAERILDEHATQAYRRGRAASDESEGE